MDHFIEPPSSQAIDEDNQEAVVNANVAELESQYEDDNNETLTATPVKASDNVPTQPSAPKKRKQRHQLTLVVENNLHHQNESSNLPMMMLKKKMSSSSLPLQVRTHNETLHFSKIFTFIYNRPTTTTTIDRYDIKHSFFFAEKLLQKARGIQEQQPLLSKI